MIEIEVHCPACDGDGSRSAQLAKEQWIQLGGGKFEGGIYFTPDGNEICFKTIGGPCSICQGKKVIEKILSYEAVPVGCKLDYQMVGYPITPVVEVDDSIAGVVVLTNPQDGTKIPISVPTVANLILALQGVLEKRRYQVL